MGKFSCLKWFKTADLGNAQRICFFILRGPGALQSDYYTGSSLELEYGLLAPLSLFETRVFVDGHDAWVLGKECVDYLERGPRRRRSAVRGCSSVPPWHLVRQTGAFKQLNLSDHSHQLMLVYYLSSNTAIMQSFDIA